MNFTDCAVLIIDDPNGYAARITAGANLNMLVRTRADEFYFPGIFHVSTCYNFSGGEYLTADQISNQYFIVADLDNSGTLSQSEVLGLTAAVGVSMTLTQLNQLAQLCASGGSTFTFPQFNCAINFLRAANIEGKFPIFNFPQVEKFSRQALLSPKIQTDEIWLIQEVLI